MAASPRLPFLVLLLCVACWGGHLAVRAQVDDTSLQLMMDAFEWPTTTSVYSSLGGMGAEGEEGVDGDIDGGASGVRRALFWRMIHYYISYGALSANRVPCPPRSGRSYYTHNCYRARGPVNPYNRGCSAITRCRS
ncbi:hypothetical protein Taro_041583 [Colocasia esculenta]|uniref:Uncharacterized protein n=1 Tax=Colocasia esculenta TaxID=4460 RepID=A0A843WER5_COLES|nr:hypothetical protein [Colocasia esculenta]